jgi:hypothetical protein
MTKATNELNEIIRSAASSLLESQQRACNCWKPYTEKGAGNL